MQNKQKEQQQKKRLQKIDSNKNKSKQKWINIVRVLIKKKKLRFVVLDSFEKMLDCLRFDVFFPFVFPLSMSKLATPIKISIFWWRIGCEYFCHAKCLNYSDDIRLESWWSNCMRVGLNTELILCASKIWGEKKHNVIKNKTIYRYF